MAKSCPKQPCPIIHVHCTAAQSQNYKCSVRSGSTSFSTKTSTGTTAKVQKLVAAQNKRRCKPLVRMHVEKVRTKAGPQVYKPLTSKDVAKATVETVSTSSKRQKAVVSEKDMPLWMLLDTAGAGAKSKRARKKEAAMRVQSEVYGRYGRRKKRKTRR